MPALDDISEELDLGSFRSRTAYHFLELQALVEEFGSEFTPAQRISLISSLLRTVLIFDLQGDE